MSKSTYGLMVIMVLLVAAAISSGVVVQGTDPPAPNDPAEREDVTKDFFDDDGTFIHPDQKLADATSEYEGGFGGYYFDETDKSCVYVYMKDTTKTANAASAFRDIYQGQHTATTITTVQGQYAFDDLMTWLPIATEALDDNDISISTSSVKEIYNRIEFGLRDWSQLADAKSAIGKTTVPVGAVRFVERTIRLYADKARPPSRWAPSVLSNAPSGCTRTRTTSAPSGVPSWAASSTGHPFGNRLVDAPSGL